VALANPVLPSDLQVGHLNFDEATRSMRDKNTVYASRREDYLKTAFCGEFSDVMRHPIKGVCLF